MKLRYWELVGKKVISADGQKLGRVAELITRKHGDQLQVVELQIGAGSLIARIGFKKFRKEMPSYNIPWQQIGRIDKQIYLKVNKANLPQEKHVE
ncbi:MAG TPA: PRC-barrel domain-containing protein [Chloroflexia bacterium]|nr:PRC-barrel domain-containing protein [Chloroflexia bacterium]